MVFTRSFIKYSRQNQNANMEICLKLLPRKSYDKNGLFLLMIFVSIGVVVIGIAGIFEAKATLQCNPDKKIASDVSTRKYIDTQCFLKYTQEFYTSLPIYVLVLMNFGIVYLLSIIYAHLVEHRVEIFTEPRSVRANDAEEESQPLSVSITAASADPTAHRKSAGRYIVFTAYVTHLIVCRIIPLVIFAELLLSLSNFPVQFKCHLPTKTTSIPPANVTQSANFSIVDCTFPMGSNNKGLAMAVVTVNCIIGTLAFVELVYLLCVARKNHNLLTDREFCRVYLRKRKRIRKLLRIIRENIPEHLLQVYDDFGEKRLSHRELKKMYVNVIIQEGRAISERQFKDRHETYEAHLEKPKKARKLKNRADLFEFKSTPTHNPNRTKSVLVVGRPGIGKTALTKMMLYDWQKQKSKFWHDKIAILIRFRCFNTGEVSLQKVLQESDGLKGTNISADDFTEIYEYICLNPSKVVLIFDGLDELKVDDDSLTGEGGVNGNNEETHIFHIWKQLVRGQLLPGAIILTTSRPTAENLYKPLQFHKEIEILGFHKEEIKIYVEKFCSDDEQKSTEIWNLIKESPELLSLCYIPVSSYIVCLTLDESVKMDKREEVEGQSNVPKTITELYKRAINILLFKHHLAYKDKENPKNYITAKLPKELQDDLNKLKAIARKGMMEEKLIFYDNEVDPGISDCGLFNKLEDKRQNIFCFLHLTIQEFLAALDVVDDMDNVESFLSEHIENPKWHLVILFVAGLIGDKFKEMESQRYSKLLFHIF